MVWFRALPVACVVACHSYTFDQGSCPFNVHSSQVKGETYRCGFVDMGTSEHTHVSVPVLVFIGGKGTGAAPLMYLAGGPSQSWSNLGLDAIKRDVFAEADRDYVFIEQRGTGVATPSLACPSAQNLAACYQDIAGKDAHTEDFNTRLLADDVEHIRQALGYKTMIPLGTSYGTTWARGIAGRHPDNVERVILNSAVIATTPLLNHLASSTDEAFTNLFKACAADRDCNIMAPDLETRMLDVMDRLKASPIKDTKGAVVLDDEAFLYATRGLLSSSPEQVPAFILSVEAGTGVVEAQDAQDQQGSNEAIGQYYSVFCGDNENASSAGIDLDLKAVRSRFADILGPAAHGLLDTCATWPHGDGTITSFNYPGPALVLVGEFDPRTPPSFARDVLTDLRNGHLVVVPGKGHDVATSSPCVRSIVASFLGGTDNPNQTCTQDMTTVFASMLTRDVTTYKVKAHPKPIDWVRY